MIFHIVTIFPKIFDSYFNEGIIRRARDLKKVIDIKIYDLRDFTSDKHRKVDDTPYGGGPGMVLKIEPMYRVLDEISVRIDSQKGVQEDSETEIQIESAAKLPSKRTILFSAKGKRFTQEDALRLAQYDNLVMICGRYEGVDERVAENLVDEELSIGDYVLTGGEIPAMVVVDAVSRLIPDVLGNPKSLNSESYNQLADGETEVDFPVYTKPENFQGWKVPEVLLTGNHGEIEKWRKKNSK